MPVLPPRDPRDADVRSSGIMLPNCLWEELADIARLEGYSRNEVIAHFIRWSLAQYRAEKSGDEKKAG